MSNAETVAESSSRPVPKWNRSVRIFRAFGKPVKFILGVLLSLTPLTAVIVLGWLARFTERKSANYFITRLGRRLPGDAYPERATPPRHFGWPGWFVDDGMRLAVNGESPSRPPVKKGVAGFLASRFGGFWDNLKAGLQSLTALAVLTLPFGALWFLGWWSGWQNSFTKGYEQAFAGPAISLLGIALSLMALSYLPMALAHLSLERRISSFFHFGRVLKLIHTAGWRYILLSAAYVIAALPVFLANAAPVFIENYNPGISDMSPEEIGEYIGAHHFWTSVYILAALLTLRAWAARIYARSALDLYLRDETGWGDTRIMGYVLEENFDLGSHRPRTGPAKIRAVLLVILLPAIWFGLVAQTYVGQFMNYKWWNWLNHPLVQIPWFPPLGPWA